jgi:hypothetical protein
VFADGSWLATVPANIPIHLQAIDNFGMSLFNEPVWFSARAGESRVCGGCHEDRAKTTVINPGSLLASTVGPTPALGMVARANRISTDADLADVNLISATGDRNATLASAGKLIGMGWSKAIQPIFDGRCTTCHDGTPGPANPSYQIVDPATGMVVFSFTFNLTSTPVMIPGEPGEGPQTYPASYIAVAGVDMEAIERGNLMITGTYKPAGLAMNSRESDIITHVNPTQIFPTPSATRAFTTTPHSQAQGYTELSSAEFLRLITVIDNGLNFYSRETAPGGITD